MSKVRSSIGTDPNIRHSERRFLQNAELGKLSGMKIGLEKKSCKKSKRVIIAIDENGTRFLHKKDRVNDE